MTDDFTKFIAPDKLEIVRILPATPERVWEYLVDPELRSKWFCGGKTGSKPGEPFVMDFDHSRMSNTAPPEDSQCGDPVVMEGTIATYEPPHTLAYHWPGTHEDRPSLVTIELTQEGNSTRLKLTHSRLDDVEFQKGASAGWHAHLDLMVDLVGGVTVRDFWTHYSSIKSEYDSRFESIVSE